MFQNLKLWMGIVVVLTIIPLVCLFVVQLNYRGRYSQAVQETCQDKAQISCRALTLGAWHKECYYDSRSYLPSRMSYKEDMRPNCFGYRSFSDQPKDCYNSFVLKGQREVTCEEFFRAIENKNNLCGNCVKMVKASNGI